MGVPRKKIHFAKATLTSPYVQPVTDAEALIYYIPQADRLRNTPTPCWVCVFETPLLGMGLRRNAFSSRGIFPAEKIVAQPFPLDATGRILDITFVSAVIRE